MLLPRGPWVSSLMLAVGACSGGAAAPGAASSAAPHADSASAELPPRAEAVAAADALAVAASKAAGDDVVSLTRRAAELRARLWRMEHRELDALEAIEEAKEKFQKLADMKAQCTAVRLMIDHYLAEHLRRRLTLEEAAIAKLYSTESLGSALDTMVQLHGGYGFMNEYRAARAWRDARVTKIWAGSNEIMKELIGRDLGL